MTVFKKARQQTSQLELVGRRDGTRQQFGEPPEELASTANSQHNETRIRRESIETSVRAAMKPDAAKMITGQNVYSGLHNCAAHYVYFFLTKEGLPEESKDSLAKSGTDREGRTAQQLIMFKVSPTNEFLFIVVGFFVIISFTKTLCRF